MLAQEKQQPIDDSVNTGVILYNHFHFTPLGFAVLNNKPNDNFGLNAFLCVFSNSSLTDRTQTIDQGFKTCILDPFPDFSNNTKSNLTFSEICDQRALDIVNQARDEQRPIHVFWSGGIDSTAALIALLKNIDPKDQKELITVFLNKESIDEYPYFYTNVILPNLKVRVIDDSYDFLLGNPIIVTGELGDQLFGSVIMDDLLNLQSSRSNIDIFHQPYKSVMPKFLRYRLKTDDKELVANLMDYLFPLIEKCPWPIVSMYDCLWWMNFTLKWQHVDQRFSVGFHLETLDLFNSYKLCAHFFKTEAFQQWSVANPDLKIKNTWASYKFPAKEYIYEFSKDKCYFEDKHKVPSISLRSIKKSRHCFMLDDFKMISAAETMDFKDFRNKYNDKYDWIFENN